MATYCIVQLQISRCLTQAHESKTFCYSSTRNAERYILAVRRERSLSVAVKTYLTHFRYLKSATCCGLRVIAAVRTLLLSWKPEEAVRFERFAVSPPSKMPRRLREDWYLVNNAYACTNSHAA